MATITTIKQRIEQLDAGHFQILCDAYLSREGYPNLVALGTKAGTSKTTLGTPDTYFCLKVIAAFFQSLLASAGFER